MMENLWQENWEQTIQDKIEQLGFNTFLDYLLTVPSQPYKNVANLLGINAAPIQLIAVQYDVAKKNGEVREAAMDSLCRNIIERLPNRWNEGDNPEQIQIKALSGWASEIMVTGDLLKLEPILNKVIEVLRLTEIPDEWKPTGIDDPIILNAFNEAWLTDGIQYYSRTK